MLILKKKLDMLKVRPLITDQSMIIAKYELTDFACLCLCLCLCQGPEMTKVIQSYNKLAMVLLQYEVVHLQAWSQAAESAPHFLNAALLVRHENRKVLDECGFKDKMIKYS